MPHDFQADALKAELTETSRINLEIQKLYRERRSFGRNFGSVSCCLNSPDGDVADFNVPPMSSAHEQMKLYALQRDRDTRISALYARFLKVGCIFEQQPNLHLIFGLTDAGNPAITIKVDGISIHERPVTPRTLVPKIIRLADLLDAGDLPDDVSPLRKFMVKHVDQIIARTPGQAIWKWLCLRHPLQAVEILRMTPGSPLPDHKSFAEAMRGVALQEVFCARTELAQARGLHHELPDILGRHPLLWDVEPE